jgi:hypothetical protein
MTDVNRANPSTTTRTVMWSLLALCAVGNLVLSTSGGPLVAHFALGVAALLCIAGLTVSYLRGRR